jgi:hypothetical protein
MTAPKAIAWLRANDRYRCAACNLEFGLALDKQLAGLDRSSAIDEN